MTFVVVLAGCYWLGASLMHLASLVMVAKKLNAASQPVPRRINTSLVSIVRPVNGLEAHVEHALQSSFMLDDQNFELIFCAQSESDAAVPLVRRLMAAYPHITARCLCGSTEASGNPKFDNMAKSWPEVRGEWVIFSDGNIILPPDYVSSLLAAWTPSAGAVSIVHIGGYPQGFWAELECVFLNQYQARWHMFSSAMGAGFVHGKTMLVRRSDLEADGGIARVGSEIAEDVALTKIIKQRNQTIETPYRPTVQPLGRRTVSDVYMRQLRWARIRRQCYPAVFLAEILSGGLLPAIAVAVLAWMIQGPVAAAALAQLLLWYGAELMFAYIAGWNLSRLSFPASLLRDLSIPMIWTYAWVGRTFRWGSKQVYGVRHEHL